MGRGATLVAEVWPESLRVKGAGLLQSAWGAGFFLAAGVNWLLAAYHWRLMFLAGLFPAVVAVVIRLKVREPERWMRVRKARQAKSTQPLTLKELFVPALRRDTLVGTGLAFVAVFGLWGATNWTPSLIRELLRPELLDAAAVARLVSYAVMALNAGAILGYLAFPFLAESWGRRPAFLIMMLGGAISLPLTFLWPTSYSTILLLLPVLGFFHQRHFQRLPRLSTGDLPHANPGYRSRLLLQCRQNHGCGGTFPHGRVSGSLRDAGTRGQFDGADLCAGLNLRVALRARDQRRSDPLNRP